MKTLQEATTIAETVRRTWVDPRLCATFEEHDQPRRWLQYGDRRINACYPSERNPNSLLAVLGGELHSWECGRYLTVDLPLNDAEHVAHWIRQYFQWVLDSEPGCALRLRLGRFTTAVVRQ